MKKIYYLFFGALFASTSLNAQFTDNFDSYTVGGYLGVQSGPWTTWSGTQGAAEDVQIVNNNSVSGSNSIYFSSTVAAGGPDDVVLPFGGVYTTGDFVFEAKFFVQSGKGAYFNFQGAAALGNTFAMQCYMVNDGNLYLDNQSGLFFATTYPTNAWFTLRFEINLNTNHWEIFIDGVSKGVFQNPINRIASLDLYPVNPTAVGGNDQSGFWVDDLMYQYTPYTLTALNAGVTLISVPGGLATQSRVVTASVRNLGVNAITSFDLTYDYNGSNITENITGVNITSLNTYNYNFTAPITLAAGSNNIQVNVSNVNGNLTDGDSNDDTSVLVLNPVVPAAGRVVVAEEGTGTWCGWCPRGAVFMEDISTKYGNFFAGIAVHNSDPMTVTAYDAAMGALIGGYPSALVDRQPEIDPSQIEQLFLQRIVIAPTAVLENTSSYNAGTQELTVNVKTTWNANASGNWRLAVVLTEDGVTGTSSGYNQNNYYAGGSNGVMGGYETLPSSVPAAQMVYDHVARAITPSFTGQTGLFPGSISSGSVYNNSFVITIDPTWDLNSMHIISMLIDPSGDIDNAGTVEYLNSNSIAEESTFSLVMYPNPADDYSNISLTLEENAEVAIEVIDINGKIVAAKNYGTLSGKNILPVNTNTLASGIYLINVRVGAELKAMRLIVR